MYRKVLIGALLLGAMSIVGFRCSKIIKTYIGSRSFKKELNTVNKILDIQDVQTSVGCPTWLVSDQHSDVVTCGFRFKGSGDVSCHPNDSGLGDLLASMLMEGAGDLDNQAFKKLLIDHNIQLSIFSAQDDFTIQFRTTKQSLEKAFEVIHLILTTPRFASSDLERVKKISIASLQQRTHDPDYITQEKYTDVIFGPYHPYNLKTKERIKKLKTFTADDLRRLMSKIFVKSRLLVAACGNISAPSLRLLLEKTFTNLEKGVPYTPTKEPLKNLGTLHRFSVPIPQAIIRFVQPGLNRSHPDLFAYYLITESMGGDFETRLMSKIRETNGLAYYCSTFPVFSLHSDEFAGVTATNPQSIDRVIKMIREEWDKLKEKGLTEDEFKFHKERIIGEFALGFGSSRGVVGTLLNYASDGLPINYVNTRNQQIQKLTLQDINRVISDIIRPDLLTFVVVGGTPSQPSKNH